MLGNLSSGLTTGGLWSSAIPVELVNNVAFDDSFYLKVV
jgi:hypothetical protein